MTIYKSFSDIQKIDAELASSFNQPDDAVRWCLAIEGPVSQWVNEHKKRGDGGKGLWEIVCFASVRKGIFDVSLPRKKRAALLVRFCPCAFCEPEMKMAFNPDKEIRALQTSMEHSKYKDELKKFDKLCDSNITRLYVNEIEALLDAQTLPLVHEEEPPTIEERVEYYLRSSYNYDETVFPCYRLHIRKDYGNEIVPGISLAMYQRPTFLDNDKPSIVWTYEFIEGTLTPDKLYAYIGKYATHRGLFRPYIVSTSSFNRHIINIAETNRVGLVLVNRNAPMTKDSYIVERSIEDYAQRKNDMEVLRGERYMRTTLMIYDSEHRFLTSSLSDWLVSENIGVKPGSVIMAPYLTNDFIERKADELTKCQVEKQMKQLEMFCVDNKKICGQPCINFIDLEINPYIIAEELGISYVFKELPTNDQWGYLDVNTGTIYLKQIGRYYQRDRFTIAHELGHHQLHLSLLRQYHYTTVGENDKTINDDVTLIKGELKWMEHHANYFAACLLMPKALVKKIYDQLHYLYIQQQYGDPPGPLYYNPMQQETFDSYNNVVVRMAKNLDVSPRAMCYRLKKLGLLIIPFDD